MANDECPGPKTLLLCRMKHTGFDLEERTAILGEAVIEFCLGLPINPVARTLWQEAKELNLIFSRIVRTTDHNLRTAAS
jgi:hypothetical protein